MKYMFGLQSAPFSKQYFSHFVYQTFMSTYYNYYSNFNDAGKMTTAKSNVDLFDFLILW